MTTKPKCDKIALSLKKTSESELKLEVKLARIAKIRTEKPEKQSWRNAKRKLEKFKNEDDNLVKMTWQERNILQQFIDDIFCHEKMLKYLFDSKYDMEFVVIYW